MRRIRAFTLIELLVVVAIISLLMSILTPCLARSKELVRRAVCVSNMSQTIRCCLAYASESREAMPPSQWKLASESTTRWAYAFDIKNSLMMPGETELKPLGVGLTVSSGYLSVGQLPGFMHCLSLNTSSVLSKGGQAPTTWHSMNVDKPNWWNGIGTGWWSDVTKKTVRSIVSYNYRSPSYYWTHNNTQLRSSGVASSVIAYADSLDPRFGGQYCHRDGYNIIRIDGSGRYVSLDPIRVEAIAMADGIPCTDGYINPADDEQIFTLLEQQP